MTHTHPTDLMPTMSCSLDLPGQREKKLRGPKEDGPPSTDSTDRQPRRVSATNGYASRYSSSLLWWNARREHPNHSRCLQLATSLNCKMDTNGKAISTTEPEQISTSISH
mmetsp:Transcript_43271/g.101788  ORF Transcript_43271/g.101788 Transcript_43271/m.101788 type:complete len:110 (-) Transcript_43271:38-367(-)